MTGRSDGELLVPKMLKPLGGAKPALFTLTIRRKVQPGTSPAPRKCRVAGDRDRVCTPGQFIREPGKGSRQGVTYRCA